MEFIPVKTRILHPPQDNLLMVLRESLPSLQEKDIVIISSKVVAIHEGQTKLIWNNDKKKLMEAEADLIIDRPYWPTPLTVKHNAFIGSAGIDESNGDGYYILLPSDVFESAIAIRAWLQAEFNLTDVGVIITDSHSTPFRFGATGVALGWAGILPIEDCRGREDLFKRKIIFERSNLVDGLAAGANVLMGEVDERIPVVIARDVPRIKFRQSNTKEQVFVDYEEDTFRVLYERFLPKDK
jgi:dihydrofolate synthase / folylpolyglutamate synthase